LGILWGKIRLYVYDNKGVTRKLLITLERENPKL
jgi:hypothetical protein